MSERDTDSWDPAAPTYRLSPVSDAAAIDAPRALAALVRHGVGRASAHAALAEISRTGTALVQSLDADWQAFQADLEAAGLRAQAWMGW